MISPLAAANAFRSVVVKLATLNPPPFPESSLVTVADPPTETTRLLLDDICGVPATVVDIPLAVTVLNSTSSVVLSV
jgi:hypothetical protein